MDSLNVLWTTQPLAWLLSPSVRHSAKLYMRTAFPLFIIIIFCIFFFFYDKCVSSCSGVLIVARDRCLDSPQGSWHSAWEPFFSKKYSRRQNGLIYPTMSAPQPYHSNVLFACTVTIMNGWPRDKENMNVLSVLQRQLHFSVSQLTPTTVLMLLSRQSYEWPGVVTFICSPVCKDAHTQTTDRALCITE